MSGLWRGFAALAGAAALGCAGIFGQPIGASAPRRTRCDDPAAFCAHVAALDGPTRTAMTGVAWRPGCPVELADLRRVRLRYWGFDGVVHEGVLVVHRAESSQVVAAFDALFSFRFPIRRMEPIEAFGGDDDRSTRADNTSAFNCRPVRATSHWSQHAFGRAVDINPLENPYVYADGTVLDPASANFIDRPANRGGPGVIDGEGLVVRAFSGVGWGWGGRWKRTKDYQHFSASGG